MAKHQWFEDSGDAWFIVGREAAPPYPQLIEQERAAPQPIYDANGTPLVREKLPFGFHPPRKG